MMTFFDYSKLIASTALSPFLIWFLIYLAVIWTLIWKGLALWRAARTNQPIWFIVFLIFNTLGILEILYLYIFSQPKRVVGSKS